MHRTSSSGSGVVVSSCYLMFTTSCRIQAENTPIQTVQLTRDSSFNEPAILLTSNHDFRLMAADGRKSLTGKVLAQSVGSRAFHVFFESYTNFTAKLTPITRHYHAPIWLVAHHEFGTR